MDPLISGADTTLRTLFRRCVQCPQNVEPVCPTCPSGTLCQINIQNCNSCASTSCVADNVINPSASSSTSNSGSAAGPIAGGVVGGIAAIAIITYLVWRFCIKKRRQEFDDAWPDEASGIEKGGDHFSLQREARMSTNTIGSIASTVYTRASNIIQIAYIPGVTNRSVESSPELIPPVPPIPAASPGSSSMSTPRMPGQDQHFFMPSDLRDSRFSGYSDRTSMARNSVATTMYRNDAVVNPVPARTATMGKAVPVSVKSSSKSSPTRLSRASTPPMPSVARPKQAQFQLNTKSSIVGRIATPKAVTVVKNSSPPTDQVYELSGSEHSETPLIVLADRRSQNPSPQYSNISSNFDDESSEDDKSSRRVAQRLLAHNRQSDATTVIQDDSPVSPSEAVPFNTSSLMKVKGTSHLAPISSRPSSKHKHKKSSSLNQIIEEATRRAMREPRHGGLGSYMKGSEDTGPFSDEHVAGTP
ncbi:hypothetical protein MMC13_003780 [Lambiella insularis]|nr:hypothetical protein [Lambiella insularis]